MSVVDGDGAVRYVMELGTAYVVFLRPTCGIFTAVRLLRKHDNRLFRGSCHLRNFIVAYVRATPHSGRSLINTSVDPFSILARYQLHRLVLRMKQKYGGLLVCFLNLHWLRKLNVRMGRIYGAVQDAVQHF